MNFLPWLQMNVVASCSTPLPFVFPVCWLGLCLLYSGINHLQLFALFLPKTGQLVDIFLMRRTGRREPSCPQGIFAVRFTLDSLKKSKMVCLSILSIEDVEDIYAIGMMTTGVPQFPNLSQISEDGSSFIGSEQAAGLFGPCGTSNQHSDSGNKLSQLRLLKHCARCEKMWRCWRALLK